VPAVHDHPYVMYSREVYLQRIEREMGVEEARFRMLMSETVSGVADIEARIRRSDDYRQRRQEGRLPALFARGLERYDIRGVCLNRAATHFYAIRERLEAEDFTRLHRDGEYEIWAREGPRS